MKRRDIALILLLGTGLSGCDSVREKIPFLGKKKEAPAVARQPATPAVDSTATPAPETPAPAPAAQPAAKRLASSSSAMDEPWTPTQTGTVNPGMTRDQVIAVWGEPVAERTRETLGFLYFRNGCEVSCGTFDVVFLENGQVVDAVVRGSGHEYSGNSSSPPGRKPEATGTQLSVPAQSTPADSATTPAVAPAPSREQD